jgi:hypothetical protein
MRQDGLRIGAIKEEKAIPYSTCDYRKARWNSMLQVGAKAPRLKLSFTVNVKSPAKTKAAKKSNPKFCK